MIAFICYKESKFIYIYYTMLGSKCVQRRLRNAVALSEKGGVTLRIYTRHVTSVEEKRIISNAANKTV